MVEIMNLGEAFKVLKPACNRLMKEPTKDHILELKSLIGNVSPSALEQILDVILFPLEVHLQNRKLGTENKRYIVDCMKKIIDHVQIDDVDKLFKLQTLLFIQIYDSSKSNLVGNVPEELKLSVVECVTSLFKHASSDIVFNKIYDKKYIPKIGQSIYICLQMAQFEKLRSLRIGAIECVMTLAFVHEETDKDDIVLRHQVGDVIMFFLPGIVGALQNIATEDEKQGHQITLMAVKAWAQIISLIMDDKYNPPEPSAFLAMEFDITPKLVNNKEDPLVNVWKNRNRDTLMKSIQEKSRTPEWYHAAGEKLAFSVRVVIGVGKNSHWKVRLELALACHTLLSRCCRNLKPCVMDLVEILIALSEDENEKVSDASKSGLNMFSEKCKKEEGKSFLEMLEDNFYSLMTKLPRILHGTDDVQQLAALRLLAGYIKLLGPNILPQVLISAAHLNRLVQTLIQAVELEGAVSLLEDYSLRDLEANHILGHSVPWKQFKHFMDDNILKYMVYVCNLLGKYGDLQTLTYHLLDVFHSNPQHRKEVILLLNEILIGGSTRYDVNLKQIVETVLETYLEPSVWYININVDVSIYEDEEISSTTLKEAQFNVVQVCLLVEGVGKMAKVLGSNFDLFLLKTLYLVLERAGSTNGLIAAAGMVAAQDIANACGHGNSVIDLVQANADYFSFHVTTRLRNVAENPGVLDVLNVVMKYSTLSVLKYLDEIIKEALLHCSDAFQAQNALSYLRVFQTFVISVRHWLNGEQNISNTSSDAEIEYTDVFPKRLIPGQVVKDLVEYHRYKKKSEDFNNVDNINETENASSNNEIPEPEEEESKKKILPLHVTMTVDILKKCVHFLPTKKKDQKLVVLSILQNGLLILEKWENELLPIAHAIWSPFVDRFNEVSDPLIVNRSFGLLCVLAKTAKDFIRSRTLKNVLPALCQFLSKSAVESKKKDKGSSYRFTQIFKLQNELLSNFGDLIIHLKLLEREIDQVLNAATPYLSSLQPLSLQDSCVNLFKRLATIDRDAVWLKVINIWSPFQLAESSFEELQPMKITRNTSINEEEFKKNIQEILSFLNVNLKIPDT